MIDWPPEKDRMIEYKFNDLSRDYVEIRAEEGSERPNKSKTNQRTRERTK